MILIPNRFPSRQYTAHIFATPSRPFTTKEKTNSNPATKPLWPDQGIGLFNFGIQHHKQALNWKRL
jgi:hypothetical protein